MVYYCLVTQDALFCRVYIVGKLGGRELMKRVRAGSECAIEEEQCGYRLGRGCRDQAFAVRQLSEKYLANGKDIFWAFMDLKKANETLIGRVSGKCEECMEL